MLGPNVLRLFAVTFNSGASATFLYTLCEAIHIYIYEFIYLEYKHVLQWKMTNIVQQYLCRLCCVTHGTNSMGHAFLLPSYAGCIADGAARTGSHWDAHRLSIWNRLLPALHRPTRGLGAQAGSGVAQASLSPLQSQAQLQHQLLEDFDNPASFAGSIRNISFLLHPVTAIGQQHVSQPGKADSSRGGSLVSAVNNLDDTGELVSKKRDPAESSTMYYTTLARLHVFVKVLFSFWLFYIRYYRYPSTVYNSVVSNMCQNKIAYKPVQIKHYLLIFFVCSGQIVA